MSNVIHMWTPERVPRGEQSATAHIALCGRPLVNTMLSAVPSRLGDVTCVRCRRLLAEVEERREHYGAMCWCGKDHRFGSSPDVEIRRQSNG